MVSDFIRLEWKQFIRSSYWQKSVALNIFLVLIALYFILVFFGLGIALFPLLKEHMPDKDPFNTVNQFLFFWFLADLLMRFFFQKLPVMSIKPLLALPVKKNKIVHYVLGKSVLSFFNFLPLFTVIPFGITLLFQGYDTASIVNWMVLLFICTQIINFLNFIIESKSASTDLAMSAPFLQLDLRMLWRNKRPRSTVFIVLIGLFYGLFFYPNPLYQDMPAMYVFVGIFVTGIFLINFGQFIPAWDSGYYKLLMSQNIPYKDYLQSKYLLMASSSFLMFVLSIPYVYFGWKVLLIHFAAMIYNIGINTHVLLYAGSFNRKKSSMAFRYSASPFTFRILLSRLQTCQFSNWHCNDYRPRNPGLSIS